MAGYLNYFILMICIVVGVSIVSLGNTTDAVWRDPVFDGTQYEPVANTSTIFGQQLVQTHNWHSGWSFLGFDPITAFGIGIEFFQIFWICLSLPALVMTNFFGFPSWVALLLGTPLVMLGIIFLILFFANRLGWDL